VVAVQTRVPKLLDIFKGSQPAVVKESPYEEDRNLERFIEVLSAEPIVQEEVQELAWTGIPSCKDID
jgi:hypothetical protein